MAGVLYKIDDSDVRGVLAKLARAADNPKPALEEIGAYAKFSTQRRFEKQTAHLGAPSALERRINAQAQAVAELNTFYERVACSKTASVIRSMRMASSGVATARMLTSIN